MMRKLLFLWFSFFLFSLPVLGQSAGGEIIDFETQKVNAWGFGGSPWEKTISLEEERSRAWMDALHHGYLQILDLPLLEGVTVKNALYANPALKERLGQLLLDCPKTFYQPDESGITRCLVEIPFCGGMSLRSAFYLAALRPNLIEPFHHTASSTVNASAPASLAQVIASAGEYRRLVIDLRKSNFEPSLFPRFFDEDGKLIFQEAKIPGPQRFSRPVVKFSKNIGDAEAGLEQSQTMYVAAMVPPLSKCDIRILSPDSDIFARVCRKLATSPEKDGEILVIYGNNLYPGGFLPKLQSKDKEKDKPPVAKGKGRTTKRAKTTSR